MNFNKTSGSFISNFASGFLKRAEDKDKSNAATIGAGVGLGMGGKGAVKTLLRERREEKIPKAKSWNEAKKHIRKGDVIVSSDASRAKSGIKDLLTVFGKSRQVHGSVYAGKGKLLETAGPGFKVSLNDLKLQKSRGEDFIVYRPKGSKADMDRSVARGKQLLGTRYENKPEMVGRGIRMMAGGIGGKGKSCSIGKGGKGVVCTDVIAKAHPKVMPNRYSAMEDVQSSKQLTPVVRMKKLNPTFRDNVLHRLGRPAITAAKWGLPAYAIAKGVEKMLAKKREDKAEA